MEPMFKGHHDADRERGAVRTDPDEVHLRPTDIAENIREKAKIFWIPDNRFGTV